MSKYQNKEPATKTPSAIFLNALLASHETNEPSILSLIQADYRVFERFLRTAGNECENPQQFFNVLKLLEEKNDTSFLTLLDGKEDRHNFQVFAHAVAALSPDDALYFLNKKDSSGNTALILCAQQNFPNRLRILVTVAAGTLATQPEKLASVLAAKNNDGKTSLDYLHPKSPAMAAGHISEDEGENPNLLSFAQAVKFIKQAVKNMASPPPQPV